MIKKLIIKAEIENLEEKKIRIEIEPMATNLFSSLELVGIYEFLNKKYGNIKASRLYLSVVYSEKGIGVGHRIIKGKFFFLVSDICERLKKEETGNMLKRLEGEIKKEDIKKDL